MMKVCISTGIVTFILILYCCIGVDFSSLVLNKNIIDHPFFRFAVLALMAVAFCYDHYIAIIIGIAYILTINELSNDDKRVVNDRKIVTYMDKYPLNDTKNEVPKSKIVKKEVKKINKLNNFTNEFQFDAVQSNSISDKALKTEVRVWNSGYGAAGGFQ